MKKRIPQKRAKQTKNTSLNKAEMPTPILPQQKSVTPLAGKFPVLSEKQQTRLHSLLDGKAKTEDKYINAYIADFQSTQQELQSLASKLEQARAVMVELRDRRSHLMGVAEKCVRDIVRWDSELSA